MADKYPLGSWKAITHIESTDDENSEPHPSVVVDGHTEIASFRVDPSGDRSIDAARARLFAAAPDLLREAEVLRCLATSTRFQDMTVKEALAELEANDCGHDKGAAIAKARGES